MAGCTFRDNQITAPRWCADYLSREHLEPWPAVVDPYQFADANGVLVKLAEAVSIDETAIDVDALAEALPKGAILWFGGSKQFLRLASAAAKGATSIVTDPAPAAIDDNSEARWSRVGQRVSIKSGTFLGRTYTERDAGTGFGPWTSGDDEEFLLAWDIADALTNPDCELVRHYTRIKENYLPEYGVFSSQSDIAAVNAVKTVAIAGTLASGDWRVEADDKNGVHRVSDNIAWNANTAAIQAGYDAVYGAGLVVVGGTGTVASHTLTYSGAGYAALPWPDPEYLVENLEDVDSVTVTDTVVGVAAVLGENAALARIRQLYSPLKGVN